MASNSKDQPTTDDYQRGDLVKVTGRKGKFKLFTRIETTSGLTGWWASGPSGAWHAIEDSRIKGRA